MILVILAAASTGYIVLNYNNFLWNPSQWANPIDHFFAFVVVFLALEGSRRAVGWVFPIMALFFLVYAYFGEYFPGMWGHAQFSVDYIFQTFYHTTNGMWGGMISISATILAMFSIFGAVLSATGGSMTFIKIGQFFTRNSTGGPGKVGVIASALFGMVSGSAAANVVATGVFTTP